MVRIIAVLALVIPGIISAFGIKLMRDAMFQDIYPIFFHVVVQFIFGLVFFIGGIAFIGGFIIYRDRKNAYKAIEEKQKDS
ncbi:DUF2627 domain-containing protein [Oceanobacillus halotolerans]|uniref:DUF2627 domain-containing protein n=1 Tax=Oceanobacillus halotolerans TaxID=2663380 RepID=UPI0013DC055B|nr:DUF2627 domain-containing protein [Oceanobacillus halotolerans]